MARPLGLLSLEVRVPTRAGDAAALPAPLPAIARFWSEVMGARVVEASGGCVRVLAAGGAQRVDFVAAPGAPAADAANTWHLALYVEDYEGAWTRANAARALFDNARFADRCGTWEQARENRQFRTLRQTADARDEEPFLLELEVRSRAHPSCPL